MTTTELRTPVQPGTARWDELVMQGVIKDGERNWFLGDAALEIAPMGGNNNGTDNVEANLREYVLVLRFPLAR